jgi:hypothetical protein
MAANYDVAPAGGRQAVDKGDKKEPCTVTVSYNGLSHSVSANPKSAVQALLQHAIQRHGIATNPHILSLFTEAGAELNDNVSLEAQGVECGATLLLRPGAVKGG